MRKYSGIILCVLFFALLLPGCAGSRADGEIAIPVYELSETGAGGRTATVEVMDLTSVRTVVANFGCPFAESVFSPAEGNLTEFNPARKEFKEGEVIAVVDHAEISFERNSLQASVNSALALYQQSGSERDRLNYSLMLEELERLDYTIGKYTVTAPYDCIIIYTSERNAGDYIYGGELLFSIARSDEVFAYTSESGDVFSVGMSVDIGFGSYSYTGKVVACPASSPSYSNAARQNLTVIKPDEGELEKILEDTPAAMTAGWATVYVVDADKRGVFAVPDSAVTSSSSLSYCTVLSNGERVRVQVEAGASINGYTVILSGLSEGEVVFV